MSEQILSLPKSSSSTNYVQLGYLDSYDAVVDKVYAFLVYKEEKTDTGKWLVRISSACTAGTMIDAEQSAIKSNIQRALAKGEEYVVWGFNFSTTEQDPRVVENRIYFDGNQKITHIEVHLVTRKADGSPNEEKVLKVDWPVTETSDSDAASVDTTGDQVLSVPKSSSHVEYAQLGYFDSYDAIADQKYAFLIYKEEKTDSGNWVVKISSANTAGTVIDAEQTAIKSDIQRALAKDEEYITWGFKFSTTEQDPRVVENRIYFDKDQKITSVEIHLVTRKIDGSPNDEKVLKVDWPN